MGKMITGVYPGTFDPVTNGHQDIICRALGVVDKLVIGVAVNAGKGPMFDLAQRTAMIHEEIAAHNAETADRVTVRPFDTLLVQFAREVGATMIVRGLRAVSDFEYEFQMTGMNARLDPGIETLFLMASEKHQFIASRLVKEIALLGGDISSFVSAGVCRQLEAKVAALNNAKGG